MHWSTEVFNEKLSTVNKKKKQSWKRMISTDSLDVFRVQWGLMG